VGTRPSGETANETTADVPVQIDAQTKTDAFCFIRQTQDQVHHVVALVDAANCKAHRARAGTDDGRIYKPLRAAHLEAREKAFAAKKVHGDGWQGEEGSRACERIQDKKTHQT
jgi:hypothetical protein